MKKFLLSGFLILTFGLYVYHQRFGDEKENMVIPQPSSLGSLAPASTTEPISSPIPALTPNPTQIKTTGYKDGSYTGDVADAYYGNIQVKVLISGGRITDVQFLQYPNDRSTSIEINSQAMPFLKQEAIQAQNANVDIVSGATQSSLAFRESLASALTQAK